MAVSDRGAMIAGMAPVRIEGVWQFCTIADPQLAARALPLALGSFREAEGLSVILPEAVLPELGLPAGIAMAGLTLTVHSALDGVGLTAAVAETLAAAGIPCNVVAAYHHDHVFVPLAMADEALARLRARAAEG